MKSSARAALGLVFLLVLPSWAKAQAPSPEPDSANPYQPPRLSAAEKNLDLVGALERTLHNDPNLLLQKEDVRFQEGVAQELAGDFDWTIRGELSYQHEERELRDSVKRREQERRDDLRDLNQETCTLADSLELKAEQIEAALGLPPGQVRITEDALFDETLKALEQLIAAVNDPVERRALINQYRTILRSELVETRALAQGNRQACDDSAEELARIGETPEKEDFDNASLDVSADKLLRNGILISPFLESDFEATQFVGKENGFFETVVDSEGQERERFVDFGGKNVEDLYTVRVGFEVNVPLLRNRGTEAVAAAENAAQKDLEAVTSLYRHAASESVLNTSIAYWNLYGAQQRVEILEKSVVRQEKLVRLTQDLIEGDALAAAEEARVLASEANARAQLDAASRDLVTARMGLLQAMGYDAEGPEQAPVADGPFPTVPAATAIRALGERLVEDAVRRRHDVAAARAFAESGTILARAAQINLRSRLDLSARVWTTATGESSFSNAVDRWVTPSWRLGLSFEKPLGNNEQKGRHAQSKARARQDEISAADLTRNVRIAVVLALGSLAEARERLEHAKEAESQFEKTIRAETEKLEVGDSTLVDTLLTEQQRTGSLLSRLDAEQEVAILLAQLRFETGTTVTAGEGFKSELTLPLDTLPQPGTGP